jgi:hypothetical protein
MASRVAVALDKRTPLPRLFLDEVFHVIFGIGLCSAKTQKKFSYSVKKMPILRHGNIFLFKKYHKYGNVTENSPIQLSYANKNT